MANARLSMTSAIHKTTNTAASILTLFFTSFSLLAGCIWAIQTGNWLGVRGAACGVSTFSVHGGSSRLAVGLDSNHR